jgi:hypothetical protein
MHDDGSLGELRIAEIDAAASHAFTTISHAFDISPLSMVFH